MLVVAAAAFWAGRVTLVAPESAEMLEPETAEIEVVEQEVGRVVTLTTTVTRPSSPLALNALAGVVTQVADSGEHGQGAVLYTVGQSPVVLVEGSTPFWRGLDAGARGEDVRQFQQMLADLGYEVSADGIWGASTTAVVRTWQANIGAAVTGALELGSLVASAGVPAAVSLDGEVAWPGAVLAGGEVVVSVSAGEPSFAMEVTQAQAETLPSGTEVIVDAGADGWPGVVTASTVTPDGLVSLNLTAPDGGLLCGEECGSLPPETTTTLLTRVALVPPVTGPVVPVSALTTHPDGTVSVEVITGGEVERREVELLTAADGLGVVTGLEAGERVRVFGASSVPEQPARTQDTPDAEDPSAPAPGGSGE